MALLCLQSTPLGVDANYHRIIKADIDCQAQVIQLVLACYPSKAARDAGCSPLWHLYPTVPFSALSQDPRVGLYGLLGLPYPTGTPDGPVDPVAALTLAPASA